MEQEEVKEVKVPVSGDYQSELANDKDFYDLRFGANLQTRNHALPAMSSSWGRVYSGR